MCGRIEQDIYTIKRAGKKSFSTINIPFDSQYTSVSDTEGSSLVFRKCVIYLIDCMGWVEYVNQMSNFIYSLGQSLYVYFCFLSSKQQAMEMDTF